MRAFLLRGLLELALAVAFMAAPVTRIELVEDKTEDATIEVQSPRGDRVPPIIKFCAYRKWNCADRCQRATEKLNGPLMPSDLDGSHFVTKT